MKIWKRNAVVAAVILFVCIAAYLNWTYTGGEDNTKAYEDFETGKMLGEATLVDSDVQPEAEDVTAEDDADAVETISDNTYFSDARLSRQKARDSALSILQDSAAAENMTDEAKQEAAAKIEVIAANALKEANIENLVKAKGFKDCVAFISDEGVSIIVAAPEGGLNQADVAKITDIVLTETEVEAGDIKIVEVE